MHNLFFIIGTILQKMHDSESKTASYLAFKQSSRANLRKGHQSRYLGCLTDYLPRGFLLNLVGLASSGVPDLVLTAKNIPEYDRKFF